MFRRSSAWSLPGCGGIPESWWKRKNAPIAMIATSTSPTARRRPGADGSTTASRGRPGDQARNQMAMDTSHAPTPRPSKRPSAVRDQDRAASPSRDEKRRRELQGRGRGRVDRRQRLGSPADFHATTSQASRPARAPRRPRPGEPDAASASRRPSGTGRRRSRARAERPGRAGPARRTSGPARRARVRSPSCCSSVRS